MMLNNNQNEPQKLDIISYSDELFGIKKRVAISHFSKKTDLVPEIDKNYVFDEATTLSIIMGFKYNKRVLIKACMELENPHTLNKLRQGLTGRV